MEPTEERITKALERWAKMGVSPLPSRELVRAEFAAVAEQARAKVEHLFPIMGAPSIPWEVIAPCEAQARLNHGQSLKRLAERGGLDPTEAVAVLEGRRLQFELEGVGDEALRVARERLAEIVRERWSKPREEQARAEGYEEAREDAAWTANDSCGGACVEAIRAMKPGRRG